MKMRAISLLLFYALLAGPAMAQDVQACAKKVAQACAKNYRACLSNCPPDVSLAQDECRYLCCTDNRSCLINGGCDAEICGD